MTVFRPRRWSLLTVVTALACGDARQQGQLVHPLDARIVRPVKVGSSVGREASPEGTDAELWEARQQLLGAVETIRVGTLDGPRYTVLGKIEAARLDVAAGSVALLDSRFQQVRWFSLTGEFLGSAGGAGNGPGQFSAPTSLDFGADGKMYVGDYPAILEVFVRKEGAWHFERSIGLPAGIYDACVSGTTLYLAGTASRDAAGDTLAALHTVDLATGEELRAFGWLYRTGHPLAVQSLSEAHVACVPGSMAGVVLLPEFLPEVRAYESDGTPRWITEIAGYRPWTVAEKPDGGLRIEIPEGGGYLAADVAFFPPHFVIVQLHQYTREAPIPDRKPAALHTYLLDVRSGEGVYVGSEPGRILDVDPPFFQTAVEDPFPQAVVYRMAVGR